MSPPTVVILSVLDGHGRFGLGPDTAAAAAWGVRVVPIATGIATSSSDDGTLDVRPVRPRLVAGALQEALSEPVDGMLIGLLPDYWQARAVVRSLATALPETLVYAPLEAAFDSLPLLGTYNRRLQIGALLPEATVTVLPADTGGELLGQPGLDIDGIANAVVAAGSHAAWVRQIRDDGRCIDVVRRGSQRSVLDAPAPAPDAKPHTAPATLAALLALGRGFEEATDLASRHAMGHLAAVQAPITA